MEARTGLSVVVTLGIMLALGVVGWVHRGGKVEDGQPAGAVALVTAEPAGRREVMAAGVAHPLEPEPVAEWEVLPSCTLRPNRTDAAHHFHVQRGDEVYVFTLYFTAAPEATAARPEHLSEHARYFGLGGRSEDEQEKALAALGQEAWAMVESLLQQRPFWIFTQWEKRSGTHHYFAMVLVDLPGGERRFLQEVLAENGFAVLNDPDLQRLPDGTAGGEFFDHLQALQQQAQQQRSGAWAAALRR